ncbi:MAG: flagellar M-ring protein FliF [Acidobacteria bacterium]|nr:flagellar M-ring protein FliF [Acidobacteriota bacterium]
MAGENNLADQFRKAFEGMSPTQRLTVGAISLTVLLALAGLGVWAAQDPMDVLFSNLPPSDANRIVEELRKQQVAYDLSQDQRTVSVPKSRVGDLRLKFAGDGLPRGEAIGFEKLENLSPLAGDFDRKVLYRRALESQLAGTIKSLQQVSEATVHLSPVNDSPFATEKEDAKASVLLKLKGQKLLPEENTQAIVNLVAASVEGLKPENVVVVDQYSRILSRSGRDPMVGATDAQKKVQREEEDYLVRRVTELLEPVVGLGKVRATAHVDLDFDKVKIQKEEFDPQGQVERSVSQKEEKSSKREGSGGVPGTASNVAPASAPAGGGGGTETGDKKETTTNYEITKTQRVVEQAPGSVKRLSLAVVLDNAQVWEKDPKGETVGKSVPRSAEEIKKIRDQVASAVGIQEKRGDLLTVENLAFASLTGPLEKIPWWQPLLDYVSRNGGQLVFLLLGLAVFFFVILPMLRRISATLNRPAPLRIAGADGVVSEGGVPVKKFTPTKTLQELEAEIEADLNAEGITQAPEAQRRQLIKKRIHESATSDPETVASLVRSWMLEDGR